MSKKKVNSSLTSFEGKVFPLADKKRLQRGKRDKNFVINSFVPFNKIFLTFITKITKKEHFYNNVLPLLHLKAPFKL